MELDENGAPCRCDVCGLETVIASVRSVTPIVAASEPFRAVLLRVNPDGSRVHLGDVARVEMAGESSEIETFINGRPSSGIGVRLAAGANALRTSEAVRARLGELARYFPPGLKVTYPVDTVPFVRLSIEEVVKTLLEAIVLVFLVMYLFLQNFRATLIPTIAVPVVLLGTMGVLAAFGGFEVAVMVGVMLMAALLTGWSVMNSVQRTSASSGSHPKNWRDCGLT